MEGTEAPEEGKGEAKCDASSKQCPCKCNINGLNCDQCVEGYYEFPNCHGKLFH